MRRRKRRRRSISVLLLFCSTAPNSKQIKRKSGRDREKRVPLAVQLLDLCFYVSFLLLHHAALRFLCIIELIHVHRSGASTLISSHSLGIESTTVLQAPWKSQRGEHMEFLCLRHLQLSCICMPSYYYCDDFQNHLLHNFSSSSILWFSGPGLDPFQFCRLGTDFPFKIISLTHNRCKILLANSLDTQVHNSHCWSWSPFCSWGSFRSGSLEQDFHSRQHTKNWFSLRWVNKDLFWLLELQILHSAILIAKSCPWHTGVQFWLPDFVSISVVQGEILQSRVLGTEFHSK